MHCALLLLLFAAAALAAVDTTPFNTSITYYPQFYSGACGLQITQADNDVITQLTNSFDWLRCGTCYKIQKIGGATSVVVRVSDWCSSTDCPTSVDTWGLREGSFTAIGCNTGAGRCNVTMQLVECNTAPYQNGNIALFATQWVNDYTLIFIPLNPLVQITGIKINLAGTMYNLVQNGGAAWSLADTLCAGKTFYLLITSVTGETIQTQNFTWTSPVSSFGNKTYNINKQFSLTYTSTPTSSTTPAASTSPSSTTTKPGSTTTPATKPGSTTTAPSGSTANPLLAALLPLVAVCCLVLLM